MDGLLDVKGVKNMARFISACFLLVHVVMIVLFWRCSVTPMVVFNVGSILFYATSFLLIQREWLALYTDLLYLEVVAHMIASALLTGWGSDFQVSVVGMSSIAFFAEYVQRYLGIKHAHALPLCLIGMTAYMVACAVCSFYPPAYALPDTVSMILRLSWGSIVFVVSTLVLQIFVSEATKSEKVLANRVTHDKLTGLPNRYYVAEYLEKIAKVGSLDEYWIALGDIDDFKVVNDTYGHNCGDFVLESLAFLLQQNLSDELVCRWGGEEFLVVGRIEGDLEAQRDHLDRARRVIAGQPLWYEEQQVRVSITMGLAAYQNGFTTSEWINAADEKLYEGKKNGKNQVVM